MARKAAKKRVQQAPAVEVQLKVPTAEVLRKAIDDRFGYAAAMLAQHEGLKLNLYEDRAADGTFKGYAIGVGRNLTTRGVSKAEALLLYYNDLLEWEKTLSKNVPEYGDLDEVRQAVLLDMSHALSTGGLAGFRNMRAALVDKNWRKAVLEMGDSLWYQQQPRKRSAKLMTMMLTGIMPTSREWGGEKVVDQYWQFRNADRGRYQAALGKNRSGEPVAFVFEEVPDVPNVDA